MCLAMAKSKFWAAVNCRPVSTAPPAASTVLAEASVSPDSVYASMRAVRFTPC